MFKVNDIKKLIHSVLNHKTILEAKDDYIGVIFHKDYFIDVLNEMSLCGFKVDFITYAEPFGDWYFLLIEDETFSILHTNKDDGFRTLPDGGVWFYYEDAPSKLQTSHDPNAVCVWGFEEECSEDVDNLIDMCKCDMDRIDRMLSDIEEIERKTRWTRIFDLFFK